MTQPSARARLASTLTRGLHGLGLTIDEQHQARLLDYLALLHKWNRAFNLSAVRQPEAMVSRHLLDSLSVLPLLENTRAVLDAGSGAGLPGIPLSICLPGTDFILLDSNGKKTRFLFQVRLELSLTNVEIVNQRMEDYRCDRQIDMVISRAFSSLREMVDRSGHLADSDGKPPRILAMKGDYPEQELSRLPESWQASCERLRVPGSEARRHAILLEYRPTA